MDFQGLYKIRHNYLGIWLKLNKFSGKMKNGPCLQFNADKA